MEEDSDPDNDSAYTNGIHHNIPRELHLASNLHVSETSTPTSPSNRNNVNKPSTSTFNTTTDDDENQASVMEKFRTDIISFFTSMKPGTDDEKNQASVMEEFKKNITSFFTSIKSKTTLSRPADYSSAVPNDAYNSNPYRNISKYSWNWTPYKSGVRQPLQENNQNLLHGPQTLCESYYHQLQSIQVDQHVPPQPSATVSYSPTVSTSGPEAPQQSPYNNVTLPSNYSSQNAQNWKRIKYKAHQNTLPLGLQLHSYINQEEFLPLSSLQVPINYKTESIQNQEYENSVNSHLQESISTEETQCHSDECSAVFPQTIMKNHVQSHNGKELFQCDICIKTFSDPSSLKKHKRIHTEEKQYQCNFCPMKFLYSSNLKNHKQTHTGEKPYQCDLCTMKFSYSSNLKRHRWTHTGEKPYQCNLCPKKFSRSNDLKIHCRTHTGEKLYQCDLCPKKFSRSEHLKIHRRTHTGEKPYQCDLCPMKFSSSSNLKSHRRTHTGEKPYKCDLCSSKFPDSRSMRRHRRIHTGDKP